MPPSIYKDLDILLGFDLKDKALGDEALWWSTLDTADAAATCLRIYLSANSRRHKASLYLTDDLQCCAMLRFIVILIIFFLALALALHPLLSLPSSRFSFPGESWKLKGCTGCKRIALSGATAAIPH